MTGLDPTETLAQLKPGSSMYMYDFKQERWFKQLGEGPFPMMRAMGGTLHYLPDRDLTVWYACVGNTPGGYLEGMWAYDAQTNRWSVLIEGEKVSGLMRNKQAPGDEIQAAYSARHGKLIVVNKEMTFAYDVARNMWQRVADNPGFGHDALSVFAYDSHAEVCLLVSKQGGRWSKEPWKLSAYRVADDAWEDVVMQGDPLPQDPKESWMAQQFAGYYDPTYNVLVLYCARGGTTWVYRHKSRDPAVRSGGGM